MNLNTNTNNEIQKFNQMAHQWWDPTGPCKPLHEINPLRLNFIKQFVTLANNKVIDVGCGGGILTEALAKEGANATGIDLSNDVLAAARLHLLESNLTIDYELTTVADFAEKYAEQFAVVTCMEMLEHVTEPQEIVTACSKLCKPEGYVFFSTLNRNLKSYLFAILGAEYFLKLLPAGTHDYDKFIMPAELATLARNADLELIDIAGINYNPFTKEYAVSKDTSVNYMACFQKI